MSTRLQVILDDSELAEIQALRRARATEPRYPTEQKLRVIREAAQFNYPTGDIERLLAETARGRAMGGDTTDDR
jgi:hypothetical protein